MVFVLIIECNCWPTHPLVTLHQVHCPKFKVYLSKLKYVLVQIVNGICFDYEMYLVAHSPTSNSVTPLDNLLQIIIAKCSCPNVNSYLSKLKSVFFLIAKCIFRPTHPPVTVHQSNGQTLSGLFSGLFSFKSHLCCPWFFKNELGKRAQMIENWICWKVEIFNSLQT